MACIPPVIEKRPLKKPKIGVPDIYPQEFKQREDELSAINVKQGYFDNPSYLEEYGSARPYLVSADILLNSFNLIQKRKKDVNTFQDSNKKKPVLNIKDIFWPVTARSKSSSDSWFKDLACNKSLILLAKKVPIFNKKEELFAQLFESNVPFSRAVWVIKLNAAYTSAMAENKIKKRQVLDPYSDWTQALCRYMKELIGRLSLSYKRVDNSLTVSSTYESSIPKTCDSFQISSMETASYFGNYSNTLNVSSPVLSTLGASLNFKNGSTLFSPNPSSLVSPLGQDSFFNDNLPGIGGKDNFSLVAAQNSHTGIISSGHESSVSFAANPSSNLSNNKEKMWDYMETLAWYMFREGLLDNQEYLTFVCEILERGLIDADIDKNDHILDLLLPFALKYAQSFAKSYFLARRMAYLCAAKLSELLAMANPAKQETSTDSTPSSAERLGSELVRIGNYLPTPSTSQSQNEVYGLDLGKFFHNCPHHRHLALNLSCILQVILYACPSAMVWNDILGWSNNTNLPGPTRPLNPAYLLGSPLDHLPMAPSELPIMVYPGQINHIKKCLMDEEEHIRLRSEAAENLWSIEKDNKSSVGKVINRILKVLQALDQHDYGKNELENSMDVLYRRIFNQLPEYEEYVEDDIKEILTHDEPIVFILCQWAISLQRRGLHRSMVVSHLLRMRQDEYDEIFGESDENDTDASYPLQDLASEGVSNELREALSLQPTLMKFLDLYAPTLQNNNRESIEMFLNLVLLYGELIRSNVFRYEGYLKSLICRNEIDTSNVQMPTWPLHMSQKTIEKKRKQGKNTNDFMSPTSSGHQHSSQNASGSINEGFDNVDPTAKSTSSNLVYFHYPFSNLGFYKTKMPDFDRAGTSGGAKRFSKHYQFLYHFPLLEPDSLAEMEHRLNLLFGVGKFKAIVKSELCSLTHMAKKIFFACENFYDPTAPETISDKGGDVFDATVFKERLWYFYERLNRFPLFDKVTVLNACTQLLIRSFQRFADGISRSLVRLESVMAIFECLGKIRNYRALIESLTDAFIELPRIQARLASASNIALAPSGMEFGNTSNYALLLCTRLVGVARFYFPCLVTCTDPGILFKALLAFSRAMGEIPQGCSSSLRITYSFMFDIWSSCQAVRNCCPPLLAESSHHLVSEIKRVMYGIVAPTPPPPPFPHHHPHQGTAGGALISWWDPYFFLDILQTQVCNNSPALIIRTQEVTHLMGQLEAHASKRYSFVCNSLLVLMARIGAAAGGTEIIKAPDELSVPRCGSSHYALLSEVRRLVNFCAEVTCQYQRPPLTFSNNASFPLLPHPTTLPSTPPLLNGEWLGAFKALCCPTHHMHHQHQQQQHPHFASGSPHNVPPGNANFVTVARNLVRSFGEAGRVDKLMLLYDALAQLCLALVLNHVFSLEDFIKHVALPSLLAAACPPPGGGGGPPAGPFGSSRSTPGTIQASSSDDGGAPDSSSGGDDDLTTTTTGPDEKVNSRALPGSAVSLIKFNVQLGDRAAESGARLTCYLLFRLFKSFAPHAPLSSWTLNDAKPSFGSRRKVFADIFTETYERQILISYQHNISIGALLAVFKALVLASCIPVNNSFGSERRRKKMKRKREKARASRTSHINPYPEFVDIGEMLSLRFNRFSQEVLLILTDQEWVKELFLKDPEGICSDQLLLDPLLSHKQASKLLHLICYPKGLPKCPIPHQEDSDLKRNVARILYNLDHWTLRVSYLELALMIKQQGREQDVNFLYDVIARTTVQIFQQQSEFTSDNSPVRYGTAFTHSLFSRLKQGTSSSVFSRVSETRNWKNCQGYEIGKGAANSDMGRRRKRGRPPGKATFNSKKKVFTGFQGSASPQNKSKYSPNPVATASPSKLLAGNAFSKRSPLDYSLPGQQQQQSQFERVEDLKPVSHQDAASSSEQGCGSDEEDDNTYSRHLEEHLSTDSSHFADQSVIDGYLTEDGGPSSDYEPGSVKGYLGSTELSPYAPNTSGPHSNNTESRLFSPVEQGQQCPPVLSPLTTGSTTLAKKQRHPGKATKFRDRRQHGIWLVAPLIGKLPAGVRGRVLKYAGQVLESGTHWATSSLNKLEREKNAQRSCSLLNHRPFFLLIKTCLTGPRKASPFLQYNPPSIGNQPTPFGSAPGSGLGSNLHNPTSLEVVALENGGAPDQRDHLLGSLHSQLNQLLRTSVEDRHVLWLPENARARSELREACRLRLSLVADMLDLVIKGGNALSSSSTSSTNNLVADWCCLLIQIMANDVVMSSGPSLIDPTTEQSPSSSHTYCEEEETSMSVPLSTRFTLLSGAGESNTGSHKSLFYMVFDLLATLVTSSLVNFSPSAPNSILANATMFCNPNLNPNAAASHLFGGSPLSYSTFRAPSAGSVKTDGGKLGCGQESLKLKFVAIEEAQKKAYHTLCKKLKKEVADKLDTQRLEILKILFPLPRKTEKIIVSDKWSERGSSHHMAGMRDQMIGLKPTEAVYVNPWELIEGLPKSIGGPLSLTWWHANKTSGFGPLSQVEDYRSLLLHTHHLVNRATLGSPDYFSRPLENLPEMPPSELPYGDDIDYANGERGEGGHFLTSPHSFGPGPLSTDSQHLIPDKNVHLTPTARGPEDVNYAQHQSSSGLHHSPHMGQTHAPRQDYNLMVDPSSSMGTNAYHQAEMIPYSSSACNQPPGISPNKSATNNVGGESVVGDRGMMEQHGHQHHLLQPNPHFLANAGTLYEHQPQQHAPSMYGTGPIESMINNASMRPPSEANFGIQGVRPTSRLQHAPGPPSYGIPTPRYKKGGGAGDGMADMVSQNVATNMAGNAPLKKPKQTRRRRQPRASAPNATKATSKTSVSAVQSQSSIRPEITAMVPRGSGMTAKQQGLNISNPQSSQPMGDMHQTFARNNPQNEYNWPGDYGEPRMDHPIDSRYGNPIYERQVGNGMTESKAALSSMLRSKHPANSISQPAPNAALLGSAPSQASQSNPKSVIFSGPRARGPAPFRPQQQPQHPSFGAGAAPISRNQMGPGGPRYQYTGQSGSGMGSLENVGLPPQYHPYPSSNLRTTEPYATFKEVPVQNPGPYGDQYGQNQPRKLMPVNYPQATAMTSDVGSRSYAPEPGYNFTAGPGCESVNRSKYGQAGGRVNVKCPNPDPTASSNIFDQFDFDNDDSTKAPQIDHSALFSTRGGRDGMTLQQGYGQTYEDAANSQKINKIYGDSAMKRPPSYSSFAGSQSLTDKISAAQAPKGPSGFMQHDNRNVAGNQQFTQRAPLAGGGPRASAQGIPYHVPDQNIYGQHQVYPQTGGPGGGGAMLSNALGSTIGYSQNPQGDMNRAAQQQQNQNYGQNANFYNSGAAMPASHAPFYPNHPGNIVNVNQQQPGQQHANGNNNFYNNPNMQPNRFINDGQNYYQNQ